MTLRFCSRPRARLLARFWASEIAVLVTMAVLTGLGGGFGAVVFHRMIDTVEAFAFDTLRHWLDFMGPHYVIIVPALGGLLVGPLVYFLAREAEGHGVPEVMEAVRIHTAPVRRPRDGHSDQDGGGGAEAMPDPGRE